MTHICISGSVKGLSPYWHQAIIWTKGGIVLIGPLGTNFSDILIKIYMFSFKKMHFIQYVVRKLAAIFPQPQCVNMNNSCSYLPVMIAVMEMGRPLLIIWLCTYPKGKFEIPILNQLISRQYPWLINGSFLYSVRPLLNDIFLRCQLFVRLYIIHVDSEISLIKSCWPFEGIHHGSWWLNFVKG